MCKEQISSVIKDSTWPYRIYLRKSDLDALLDFYDSIDRDEFIGEMKYSFGDYKGRPGSRSCALLTREEALALALKLDVKIERLCGVPPLMFSQSVRNHYFV